MDGALAPTLLLTRPQAASERFLAKLELHLGQRVPAIISPVLDIQPIGEVPEIGQSETVIVTSTSAVRIAQNAAALQGRRCLTVGQATADAARAAGADALCLGETVASFLQTARSLTPTPAVHLRGTHTRGDLAEHLAQAGWPVREAVIYDQVAVPVSKAALRLVSQPGMVILPLFSPRSAVLASALRQSRATLTVIAMSAPVAEAWGGDGAAEVLNNPSGDAMLGQIARAFRRASLGGAASGD